MNLTLTRKQARADGIFGVLTDETGKEIAVTLEHAYLNAQQGYSPKLNDGDHKCVRGQHQLASMTAPFETFEITGVPNHTSILFHQGNYNKDSEGCVLLGRSLAYDNQGAGTQMIAMSKTTFKYFMDLQSGINEFTLTVKDEY